MRFRRGTEAADAYFCWPYVLYIAQGRGEMLRAWSSLVMSTLINVQWQSVCLTIFSDCRWRFLNAVN